MQTSRGTLIGAIVAVVFMSVLFVAVTSTPSASAIADNHVGVQRQPLMGFGSQLSEWCASQNELQDNVSWMRCMQQVGDIADAYLLGTINGYGDEMQRKLTIYEIETMREWCPPNGVTLRDAAEVVTRYLKDDPKSGYDPDWKVIKDSLHKAWPCSAVANIQGSTVVVMTAQSHLAGLCNPSNLQKQNESWHLCVITAASAVDGFYGGTLWGYGKLHGPDAMTERDFVQIETADIPWCAEVNTSAERYALAVNKFLADYSPEPTDTDASIVVEAFQHEWPCVPPSIKAARSHTGPATSESVGGWHGAGWYVEKDWLGPNLMAGPYADKATCWPVANQHRSDWNWDSDDGDYGCFYWDHDPDN